MLCIARIILPPNPEFLYLHDILSRMIKNAIYFKCHLTISLSDERWNNDFFKVNLKIGPWIEELIIQT